MLAFRASTSCSSLLLKEPFKCFATKYPSGPWALSLSQSKFYHWSWQKGDGTPERQWSLTVWRPARSAAEDKKGLRSYIASEYHEIEETRMNIDLWEEGHVMTYKTLCQTSSIPYYCLLTITLQNQNKTLIVWQLRHHQNLPAVCFLSLNSSPLEGHVFPAGNACFVPALVTPPGSSSSRPTGPKPNCKPLFHWALVLASPFFYPLGN